MSKFVITMMSHEHHVVPNHWSFDCLFDSLCESTSKKRQRLHLWSFEVMVMRKKLPFVEDIMMYHIVKVWSS